MGKFFNFKKEAGWGELLALSALIVGLLSLYLQFQSNKAEVTLTNDKLVGAIFTDKDGRKKHFGFYRGIITNSSSKSVTLLGLRPYENIGLIITTQHGSNKAERNEVPFKIFQVADTVLSVNLFSKEQNLWDFEDQGLERLSLINNVIPSGEVYTLNIGTAFDIFADSTKNYSSLIFTSELWFSNGQKLAFGAGGDIIKK